MSLAVQVFVVFMLLLSAPSWRDDGPHALILRLLNNGITVVAFVRNQVLGNEPFNQLASMATVRPGSFCSKDSDWHTMRIHGQMYLGVEPPFVRPMA